MIQVTDLLVTKLPQSFDHIDDWVDAHGNCGTHHKEITEVRLLLNPDKKSATRISIFNSLTEMQEFEQERKAIKRLKGLDDSDKAYTVTRIQEPEEITL